MPESKTPTDDEQIATSDSQPSDAPTAPRVSTGSESSLQGAGTELGARLRKAREIRGLTVQQATDRLKFQPNIVEALESGNFDQLVDVDETYLQGYYRAYAIELGVEIGETLFAVDRARPAELGTRGPSSHINYQSPTKIAMGERLRDRSDAIIVSLVAVMVVAVAGVIWWVWPTSDDGIGSATSGVVVSPSDAAASRAESEDDVPFYLRDEPEPSAPASDLPEESDSNSEDGLSEEVNSNSNDEMPPGFSTPQTASDASEPAADSSDQSDESVTEPPSESDTTASVEVATGIVSLAFSGPSWVEIYSADDERLYYGMGQAGEVESREGTLPLSITIGDASVVTVRFNNADVDLTPHTFGAVANLTLQ